MNNLQVTMSFVDGGSQSFEYPNGRKLIHEWFTDDWGPSPRALSIKASTTDGRTVRIVIPFNGSTASAHIEDAPITGSDG
jgi:hypothetical protein